MNEKIKSLAVKARIGIWGDAYVNDFAMSIIKECITLAEKAKNTKESIKAQPDFADQLAMKSENFGIEIAVASIKKHFGIEK